MHVLERQRKQRRHEKEDHHLYCILVSKIMISNWIYINKFLYKACNCILISCLNRVSCVYVNVDKERHCDLVQLSHYREMSASTAKWHKSSLCVSKKSMKVCACMHMCLCKCVVLRPGQAVRDYVRWVSQNPDPIRPCSAQKSLERVTADWQTEWKTNSLSDMETAQAEVASDSGRKQWAEIKKR